MPLLVRPMAAMPAQRYNALLRDASEGERLGCSSAMVDGDAVVGMVLRSRFALSRWLVGGSF
jgi:hypothetical protein